MLYRIRLVESDYVKKSSRADESNKMLSCPDTHVSYARGCRAATNTMTSDDVLSVSGNSGRTLEYAPAYNNIDVASARNRTMSEFVKSDCANAAWRALPWTSHKALCPG